MRLKELLKDVEVLEVCGDSNIEINNIHFDSRKVREKDMFIALVGTREDGKKYIDSAINNGACIIVSNKKPESLIKEITYVITKDTHDALAIIASNYYNRPSDKLKLIGVTGTNGKTSVVNLLHQLFTFLGYKCGLISTIENVIVEERYQSTHTTPDPLQINFLLNKMVELGCSYSFMEVSSHAIDQKRINGLSFQLAVFTNISHDHLDYHKSFDNYISTKKIFFDNLKGESIALVNKDDNKGEIMLQNSKANKYSFSLKSFSDFKCRIIESDFNGMLLNIDDYEVWVKLIGQFNAYNLLAVYSVAFLLKEDVKDILKAISLLSSAEGRFQIFKTNDEIVFVLDYAHTDDALKNVISTINSIRNKDQKLITVFGCGGDRDKLKRPLMTKVACELSSQVILTSDNPRSEDIDEIITDMLFEINQENLAKAIVINDRKQAIKTALTLAKRGDVILVAGKGHEKFQEINGVKLPFDDKKEILKLINLNIN